MFKMIKEIKQILLYHARQYHEWYNSGLFILQYIGTQIATFVFGLIGACVVLDFSTYDSSIQPIIRDVIVRLMNNPQHEGSREILRMVQEGVSISFMRTGIIKINEMFYPVCMFQAENIFYFTTFVLESYRILYYIKVFL